MRHAPWYSLVFAAALGTGTAWGAEDIGAAVNACRAEADDARRLACYDRAVGRASRRRAPPRRPRLRLGGLRLPRR